MIPLFKVFMSPDVDKPLLEVLHSGYIGQGPKVDEFEKILSEKFGTENVLTLNSGTSALHLALRLANVNDGDYVISTPMTCTATNMPILERGAKIKWADIDPTGLIDVNSVRKILEDSSYNVKAIMCVDWGGNPCNIDELMSIAAEYNIYVIEDAAHAQGATYKNKKVGSIADFTCFSFQAIKHITTIDGGALTCRFFSDYKRGKLLRWYGIDRDQPRRDFRCEEDIFEHGYKFHMNDINATIGIEQIKHLDEIVSKQRANADYYNTNLRTYFKTVVNPESAYWLYTILLPSLDARLKFMGFMQAKGIQVSQVHARNDKHTCFKKFKTDLPGVDLFTERQVNIPVHWGLTESEREYIVNTCNEFAAL